MEVDDAKDTDIVKPMYTLLECSDKYSKISRNGMRYYRFETNGNIIDSEIKLCKFKPKFRNMVNGAGNSSVKVTVPLKNFSKFWRNLEMSLIDCEISLVLIQSGIRVIANSKDAAKYENVDAKL